MIDLDVFDESKRLRLKGKMTDLQSTHPADNQGSIDIYRTCWQLCEVEGGVRSSASYLVSVILYRGHLLTLTFGSMFQEEHLLQTLGLTETDLMYKTIV